MQAAARSLLRGEKRAGFGTHRGKARRHSPWTLPPGATLRSSPGMASVDFARQTSSNSQETDPPFSHSALDPRW